MDEESFDMEYDEKICSLSGSENQNDLDLLKHLVKNSQYICSACGRTAANEYNLCSPEKL